MKIYYAREDCLRTDFGFEVGTLESETSFVFYFEVCALYFDAFYLEVGRTELIGGVFLLWRTDYPFPDVGITYILHFCLLGIEF